MSARPMTPARGRRLRTTLLALALVGALGGASSAWSFDIPPPPPAPYQGMIFPLFPNSKTIPFGVNAPSSKRSGVTSSSGGNGGSSGSSGRVSTLAAASPQVQANARQLAQAVPAAHRDQMAQVYVQSFDTWRQLERKLGLPANDVAGAIAAFLAGNYMAYRNVEVPDATYHRLVEQMRGALANSRGFARASPSDRRMLYEQMAMVGTFMAVAQLNFQQKPNPTAEQNFRDAAAANLEVALKVPAEQVRIGERGLTLQ